MRVGLIEGYWGHGRGSTDWVLYVRTWELDSLSCHSGTDRFDGVVIGVERVGSGGSVSTYGDRT